MGNSSNKILVTGGTGFIGSHTVVALQEAGFEVVIADNLSNSNRDVLKGIEAISHKPVAFYEVDLCDREALDGVFQQEKNIHGVIHFAAYKAVGESVAKPLLYYKNNLLGMVHLLEMMQAHQVPHLIFSSSATVYGSPEQLPATETTPIQPALSPYGNTKQVCEEIIQDTIVSDADIQAIILRYFNPIGAHPSGHIGELPLGTPNNLMPFITQTAAGVRSSLKVFGKDYDTADGTAIRDYLHVVDLAEAHVLALHRMIKNQQDKACEIFNLGTGNGSSVMEVIESFERTTGESLAYEFADRRSGDVPRLYANPELAQAKLGWKPKYELDDMTRSAWMWEKKVRGL